MFVHGLTGHRTKTWTAPKTTSSGSVCWPSELLPTSIDNARIITFGYDASVVHFWTLASQNRIFDHAKALCGSLGSLREKTQTVSSCKIVSNFLENS